MKFKQKMFLITFVFVTISINLIGIIIINNNHKRLISNRIDSIKNNIYSIENILKFYNENELNNHIITKDNTSYEILIHEKIIYSNLVINKNDIEDITELSDNEIKAIILNQKIYMTAKYNDYEIIVVEKIDDIYANRQEQIYFFTRISVVSSFIIALCLYIIMSLLTIRIAKLNNAVKEIEKGNYSVRINNLGNDEIGNLAQSFNKMVYSVENNIDEIKRVSENRKNFIHDITHEIRTPLTSIIGYSSLIRSGRISDLNTIIEYNNKIYEEGNYLNLISQRLIDIILLDGKKLKMEKLNLTQSIAKAINTIQDSYNDVTFINNIKEDNILLESDEVLLHSLIMNILKNAAIACKDKPVKVVETLLIKDLNNNILLKIKDNGKGMSEEQLQKVTEPFYTLNKDRNRKSSGIGLGLPLCIKICEVLNSELKIESQLGEGTVVTIKFII